jgi:hypothetical protein
MSLVGDLSPVEKLLKSGSSRVKLPFVKALKSGHSSPGAVIPRG